MSATWPRSARRRDPGGGGAPRSRPLPRTGWRGGRVWGAAIGGVSLLLAVYLYASFGLSGGADVTRYSSGIYDMDVGRVVADFTTRLPAYRPVRQV